MTAVRLAWLELRRFRGPLRRLVPLLLCLIPLLYGAMYLWANWDPYGKTDRIPVAVVDLDRPAVAEGGRPVDAGAQLVEQLKASGTFGWQFVDAGTADAGLRGAGTRSRSRSRRTSAPGWRPPPTRSRSRAASCCG
ncbi:YhgE/Pip domain-containing protein [Kitasatospora fiedleri]|uniref:YhgE/Pip domain-containing protein n=1 Tax=Kitasatospora fiedleri TaxID=2991545 RepID=UPI00249B2BAF|nr:hypothetical protein [Kitasatospora fiedleri]